MSQIALSTNPGTVKARLWQRANRARARVHKANYRKTHPEQCSLAQKLYRQARRTEFAARQALYRKMNPEKCATAIERSRKAKPEKYAALKNITAARRRARKQNAAVPLTEVEKAQIRAIYANARALTKASGKKRTYHVDHIIPLARGGLHHPTNLQILLGVDNVRKGAK